MQPYIFMGILALLPAYSLLALESTSLEQPGIKDPKIIIELQLSALERLQALTRDTLENLELLQRMIAEYKIQQERYLDQPGDKQLLYQMSKTADQILKKMKTEELTETLDSEFIQELQLLSQIYAKISLPKLK